MSNENGFKEKFVLLLDWMPSIVECVKKDLKNDHLKKDPHFLKRYLGGKSLNKVEKEELVEAYSKAIQEHESGEAIALFLANRWIFRNSELYHFFETSLTKINPDFTAIREIPKGESEAIMKEAVERFGAEKTYLFSCINDVAFHSDDLKTLASLAKQEQQDAKAKKSEEETFKSVEALIASHKSDVLKLTDKYEKKLLGLEMKHRSEVEMLKNQIRTLQKKLA